MLATRKEHITNLFETMKKAESLQYDTFNKAQKAREAWEKACKASFMADHPEISSMVDEIERLQKELTLAKAALRYEAVKHNRLHIFRKWLD
jgi:hypothetical protein